MRSTVKVLSAVAALAMAAGLSACDEQDIAQPSSDGATASSPTKEDSGSTASSDSTSSKDSKSSEGKDGTTKSGSKILEIKPVTFKDEQIGLTQTCDKAIEDYPAPKFKQSTGGSDSGTAYLLHCTLEFVETSATAARSQIPRRSRTRGTPPSRRTIMGACWRMT